MAQFMDKLVDLLTPLGMAVFCAGAFVVGDEFFGTRVALAFIGLAFLPGLCMMYYIASQISDY